MSLGSDVLQDLTEPYVVERADAPALVNGRAVPAVPVQVTIRACIQPTAGRDLLLLEEEMRTRQTVTVFTTDLIRTADDATQTPPDVIQFAGERYQVHTVQDWMALGGYYKGIALKVPR
jgi:hypothetical protein